MDSVFPSGIVLLLDDDHGLPESNTLSLLPFSGYVLLLIHERVRLYGLRGQSAYGRLCCVRCRYGGSRQLGASPTPLREARLNTALAS